MCNSVGKGEYIVGIRVKNPKTKWFGSSSFTNLFVSYSIETYLDCNKNESVFKEEYDSEVECKWVDEDVMGGEWKCDDGFVATSIELAKEIWHPTRMRCCPSMKFIRAREKAKTTEAEPSD